MITRAGRGIRAHTGILMAFAGFASIPAVPAKAQNPALRDVPLPNGVQSGPVLDRLNLARDVRLDQKLGELVPLDAKFTDQTGKAVKFGDLLGDKPVALTLLFYKCAGACTQMLDAQTHTYNDLKFKIGQDFNVITVGIHPKETYQDAAAKKNFYTETLAKAQPGAAEHWKYLTGDPDEVKRLADAIGYHYVYDPVKDNVAHPSGLIILTPKGRVSRYFYGTVYKPKQVQLALSEASGNKIGSLTDRIAGYCSSFDMSKGAYTLNILRLSQVAGVLTVVVVAGSIGAMSFLYRRQPIKPGGSGEGAVPTA